MINAVGVLSVDARGCFARMFQLERVGLALVRCGARAHLRCSWCVRLFVLGDGLVARRVAGQPAAAPRALAMLAGVVVAQWFGIENAHC